MRDQIKMADKAKDDMTTSERLRIDLTKAMFHDDVPEMMTILAMITGAGLEMQLEAEVKSARLLIDRLATQRRVSLDELKNVVHKGDITEIKMLHSPPSLVKELMTAVLMLLGCPEKEAQQWCVCRKLLLDAYFLERLHTVDVDCISKNVARKVEDITSRMSYDQCQKVSLAASGLYTWVGLQDKQSPTSISPNINISAALRQISVKFCMETLLGSKYNDCCAGERQKQRLAEQE